MTLDIEEQEAAALDTFVWDHEEASHEDAPLSAMITQLKASAVSALDAGNEEAAPSVITVHAETVSIDVQTVESAHSYAVQSVTPVAGVDVVSNDTDPAVPVSEAVSVPTEDVPSPEDFDVEALLQQAFPNGIEAAFPDGITGTDLGRIYLGVGLISGSDDWTIEDHVALYVLSQQAEIPFEEIGSYVMDAVHEMVTEVMAAAGGAVLYEEGRSPGPISGSASWTFADYLVADEIENVFVRIHEFNDIDDADGSLVIYDFGTDSQPYDDAFWDCSELPQDDAADASPDMQILM